MLRYKIAGVCREPFKKFAGKSSNPSPEFDIFWWNSCQKHLKHNILTVKSKDKTADMCWEMTAGK